MESTPRDMSSRPYGVAFSGPGKHPRKLSYRPHRAWLQMLQRCYCEETKKRQTSYKDCIVCDEWLDYQTFAGWFVSQRGWDLDWQLDKDLLSKRLGLPNKIYSPDTCILLPAEVNKALIVREKRTDLPNGVFYNNNKTQFVARYYSLEGKNTHIGTYSSPEEASSAYKSKKQQTLNYLAEKFKEFLDFKAYHALCTFYL